MRVKGVYKSAALSAVMVLFVSGPVRSASTLSTVEFKEIKIETSIPFAVRDYDPPYRLRLSQERKTHPASSPEEAVASYILGVIDKDVTRLQSVVEGHCDAYLLGAGNADQSEAELPHASAAFKSLYSNATIFVTHQADIAGQKMIYVATGDKPSKNPESQIPFFVEKYGEVWKVTEARHPDTGSAIINNFPEDSGTLTFSTVLTADKPATRECSVNERQ